MFSVSKQDPLTFERTSTSSRLSFSLLHFATRIYNFKDELLDMKELSNQIPKGSDNAKKDLNICSWRMPLFPVGQGKNMLT